MMMSFLRSALTALLVIVGGSATVDGAVVTKNKSKGRRVLNSLSARNKQIREANKDGSFMKTLVSKAQHVGGRQLNQNNQWGENFDFDPTQYSIKYQGCKTVQVYSDELAEQEDISTVLAMHRYVIFRLCPTFYCNKYTVYGCSDGYGEYVVPLADYMQAVAQYYEERQQRYCEYCEPCYREDEEDENRRLNDAEEEEGEVCDEDNCADSYDLCYEEEPGDDDQWEEEEELEIDQYLECEAVEFGDDDGAVEYFIGPSCDSSDDWSIKLGIFSDETCSTEVNNGLGFYDITGISVDDDYFEMYSPSDCVSCKANEEAWEQEEDDGNNNNNNQQDEVTELCDNLYENAARCNIKIYLALGDDYYNDGYDAENDVTCTFIQELQQGTYDQTSTIVIDNSDLKFNASNWKDANEYLKELKIVSQKVLPWQIAALVLSLVGCSVMWVWACCLHGSLARKNIPWRPRRGKDSDPTDISRQNSGIVMGRSRSGPTAALV